MPLDGLAYENHTIISAASSGTSNGAVSIDPWPVTSTIGCSTTPASEITGLLTGASPAWNATCATIGAFGSPNTYGSPSGTMRFGSYLTSTEEPGFRSPRSSS